MGTRRRHLFVLLFVLGLVDRLGAGHRQQGDEARPRSAGRARARLPGAADRDRDRSQRRRHRRLDLDHRTADQQARRLRARSRAAGHRRDHGQPARRHRRQPRRRTGRHHGAALLLRLGAEPDRPRAGDRRHTRAEPPKRPLKASEKRWEEAGRNVARTPRTTADLRRRLPDRLRSGPARRRTGTGRKLRDSARSPSRATTSSRRRSRTSCSPGRSWQEGPLHQLWHARFDAIPSSHVVAHGAAQLWGFIADVRRRHCAAVSANGHLGPAAGPGLLPFAAGRLPHRRGRRLRLVPGGAGAKLGWSAQRHRAGTRGSPLPGIPASPGRRQAAPPGRG